MIAWTSLILQYRLASGDAEGRVVVWNLHTGSPTSGVIDLYNTATGKQSRSSQSVCALAWVGSNPCKLAVAMEGLFVVLDPKGERQSLHASYFVSRPQSSLVLRRDDHPQSYSSHLIFQTYSTCSLVFNCKPNKLAMWKWSVFPMLPIKRYRGFQDKWNRHWKPG